MADGSTIQIGNVVWITNSLEEAQRWAEHATLKATQYEIRTMPAGGIAVYEVEPVNLRYPLEAHTAEGTIEAVCDKARVLREVFFDEFEQDRCDYCGAPATVNMGLDPQLCADCADEYKDEWTPGQSQ